MTAHVNDEHYQGSTLKPCPFCGCKLVHDHGDRVRCGGCHASTYGCDRHTAAYRWNIRAPQPLANTERLDRAYSERNALVIAFAKAAVALGWKAGRGFDSDPSKAWDDDWRHVVYVELPDGRQASWHMSPAEVPLLDGLPTYEGGWDGTFLARDPLWCQFDALVRVG